MIFQHTMQLVFSGRKTQTARIWKPDVHQVKTLADNTVEIISAKNGRRMYYPGQQLSIQPARGTEAVGQLTIASCFKQDVRDFTPAQLRREAIGDDESDFYTLWHQMHDKNYDAIVIRWLASSVRFN